ncbi:MAG: tRNA lysidine(34) synthetase TilS [Candidatus Saccharimonadales bacterium]
MSLGLEKGRYVVAVSGGVDSMALLKLLLDEPDLELIVAHFDHGIRHDSGIDRRLVQNFAKSQNVRFVYDEGNLGPDASEADARKARYEFLHALRKASGSRAIITAHHQDDLLETAIINLIRGTGRSGLTSLGNKNSVLRPVLHLTKADLVNHAKVHEIEWREDTTNKDIRYLRNYIRHQIIPKLSEGQRKSLLYHINKSKEINREIDEIMTSLLHVQPKLNKLNRKWFVLLPYAVSMEVMVVWLKKHKIKDVDKKTIQRLTNFAKTAEVNKVLDIDNKFVLKITSDEITLVKR